MKKEENTQMMLEEVKEVKEDKKEANCDDETLINEGYVKLD